MPKLNRRQNTIVTFVFILLIVVSFCFAASAFAYDSPYAYTLAASDVGETSAMLNAQIYGLDDSYPEYAWFQYGPDQNYGYETIHEVINDDGYFDEQLDNLEAGDYYHYRVAVQTEEGIIYGPDMNFTCIEDSGETLDCSNTGTCDDSSIGEIYLEKSVMNITNNNSGLPGWASTVGANPGDRVAFMLTLHAIGDDVHNVLITDVLQSGIEYGGRLIVSGAIIFSGADITTGITIPEIPEGDTITITYEAQVLPDDYFDAGTVNLNNVATVLSADAEPTRDIATVIVNSVPVAVAVASPVQPVSVLPDIYQTYPTNISTGLTNDLLKDSFFLPMLAIVLGSWLYFTGRVHRGLRWLRDNYNL